MKSYGFAFSLRSEHAATWAEQRVLSGRRQGVMNAYTRSQKRGYPDVFLQRRSNEYGFAAAGSKAAEY